MDILVSGDAYVDIVAHGMIKFPDPGREELIHAFDFQPGGSAAYVAAALSMLGQKVALHSLVGNDHWGLLWTNLLNCTDVEVIVDHTDDMPTGLSFVFPVAGDRSFVTLPGANSLHRRLPRHERITHLIVSGVLQASGMWSIEMLDDISWYRQRGVPIFVDGNWSEDKRGQNFFRAVASQITALFLNHQEAMMMTGHGDPIHAGQSLLNEFPKGIIVIKLGARGAVAVCKDGIYQKDGFHIERVIDSNGAGDVFLAAFTCAWGAGKSIDLALSAANEAAALAISSSSYSARLENLKRTRTRAIGESTTCPA